MDNFSQIDIVFQGREVKSYNPFCVLSIKQCIADFQKNKVVTPKQSWLLQIQISPNAIDDNAIQRLEIRKKLADGEQIMSGLLRKVLFFTNTFTLKMRDSVVCIIWAAEFKHHKQMPDEKGTLYDFMGNTELAGNWFRVSPQTAERIKSKNVRGLNALQNTAPASW